MLAPYVAIMPRARRESLLEACRRADNPTRARAQAGLSRYTDAAYLLKYCPVCAADHIERHEFTCWLAAHQMPGVWICQAHARPLSWITNRGRSAAWRMPQHFTANALTAAVDELNWRSHMSLQQVITWMAAKSDLRLPALQVMVRLRLRRADLCRSEVKWNSAELDHLSRTARAHFSALTVPDVAQVNATEWLKVIHREQRHYNPLTWALALSWVGATASRALDEEYEDALARKPQRQLFDDLLPHGARRTAAPRCLYEAFEHADRKCDAAAATGLSETEIDGWLRRDVDLGSHWRLHMRERRRSDAVRALRTYVEAHPDALRIDVLRKCMPEYRWLESNDRKTLERLLPAPIPHLARQLCIFANSDEHCGDQIAGGPDSSAKSKRRLMNGGAR